MKSRKELSASLVSADASAVDEPSELGFEDADEGLCLWELWLMSHTRHPMSIDVEAFVVR